MEIIKVDLENITEENYKELQKICFWINREPDTDAYILNVDNDIKSVFVLKRFGEEISTTKEMDFGTKQNERGQGYASKGFQLLLEEIKKRNDIKEVYVQAFNPLTLNIVNKYNLPNDGMGTTIIQNNNFNIKYDKLCELIKSENYTEEDIVTLCNYQEDMMEVAKKWVKVKEEIQKKQM